MIRQICNVKPQDTATTRSSELLGFALKIWTSFWKREGSAGVDMWKAPRQLLTYRLMESVGRGGVGGAQDDVEAADREGLQRSARLSTLMIAITGDLVWDLPCVQQACYLEVGPLMWVLPCTCMLRNKRTMMVLYRSPEQTALHTYCWSFSQAHCSKIFV